MHGLHKYELRAALFATLATAAISIASHANAATPKGTPRSIVLVHGAFADGSAWDKVVPMLEAKGYNVVAVQQPLTSLKEDVAATKRAISEQPGQVILVGHSYGGVVITEAGNDSKVVGLVYVAAFAPDAGQSANDLAKTAPPPVWLKQMQVDEGFGRLPTTTVVMEFAQDLPAAEAKLVAVKQGPINTKNFDEAVKTAAWRSKPSWYLRAANDRMIDPALQATMAKQIKATTTSLDSSHVPMLSKPKQVAAVILDAASRATVASR
jgi:pimeloyl-ACP methyl ester carboxylesterase